MMFAKIKYKNVCNLGYDIIKKYLPYICKYKELHRGYPGDLTEEQWILILDKIIFAFVFQIYSDRNERTKLEKKLIKELILDKYGDVREFLLESPDPLFIPEGDYFVLNNYGWKQDEEKYFYYLEFHKQSQEGLELFGKYLLSLWI